MGELTTLLVTTGVTTPHKNVTTPHKNVTTPATTGDHGRPQGTTSKPPLDHTP